MERKLVIGEVEHAVSSPSRPEWSVRGELFAWITVDGVRCSVEVLDSGPHHLDLVIDGRRVQLHMAAADNGEGLWVSAEGRARLVKPARRKSRRDGRGGAGAGGQQKVTPSFPATVVKVMVAVGDVVSRGQPLVVVSAMKMEMTLSAPHDGTVTAVNVAQGAAVGPGDELVVVAAAQGEGISDG